MTTFEMQKVLRTLEETNPAEARRLRKLLEAKLTKCATQPTGRATRAQVRSNEQARMMEESLLQHMAQHHGV